jgi:hypothetical protein
MYGLAGSARSEQRAVGGREVRPIGVFVVDGLVAGLSFELSRVVIPEGA